MTFNTKIFNKKIIISLTLIGLFISSGFWGFGKHFYASLIGPNTVLFLDGANFTDSSSSSHAITAAGGISISAQETISFNNPGDAIYITDHTDWNLNTSDFTVDFWLKMPNYTAGTLYPIINHGLCSSNTTVPNKYISWGVFLQDNKLALFKFDGTNTERFINWTPSTNTWYHVAVVRTGNNLKFFINGIQTGGNQDATGLDYSKLNTDMLLAGTVSTGDCTTTHYYTGELDQVHLTKGTALWTSNFENQVPATPFEECGDGIVEGGETCDDGATVAGDGCSNTCQTEGSYVCTGQPSVCTIVCGNGIRDGNEICDDGNTNSGDGCDATCANIEENWTCEIPAGEKSTCQAIAAAEAEEEREAVITAKTIAGKIELKEPGAERNAPPKTIAELNTTTAPQITIDPSGNMIVIPGKMSPQDLLERVANRPSKRNSARPASMKGSAAKPEKPNALKKLKSPGSSLGKDFSAANAVLNLRIYKQMKAKAEGTFQEKPKTPEIQEPEITITETGIEETPLTVEMPEPPPVEKIETAPIVAQQTETISIKEGGTIEMTSTAETFGGNQEIAIEMPAELLAGQENVSIKAEILDLGETITMASTPSGKQKHIIGTVLKLEAKTDAGAINQFDKPVELSMTYDTEITETFDPQTLKLHYLNETTNTWEVLPNATIDPETRTVTATTTHFSLFTILGDLIKGLTDSEYVKYRSSVAPNATSFKDLTKKQYSIADSERIRNARLAKKTAKKGGGEYVKYRSSVAPNATSFKDLTKKQYSIADSERIRNARLAKKTAKKGGGKIARPEGYVRRRYGKNYDEAGRPAVH